VLSKIVLIFFISKLKILVSGVYAISYENIHLLDSESGIYFRIRIDNVLTQYVNLANKFT